MARRKKGLSKVYVISIGAHLLVGAVLALVPQQKLREVVAIALSEAKEEKKPEPPKPPEHPAERPAHAPGHNARPVAAAAHAPEASNASDAPAFTDIGLALDSSSSDGLAVNIAPQPVAAAAPAPVVPAKPKVLIAQRAETTCTEDIVKPRALSILHPSFTEAAHNAHVEGRVVVEVLVDEKGEVTSARVIQGLGYGLDEVALTTARHYRFSPATRCGKPVASPFVLRFRFGHPT